MACHRRRRAVSGRGAVDHAAASGSAEREPGRQIVIGGGEFVEEGVVDGVAQDLLQRVVEHLVASFVDPVEPGVDGGSPALGDQFVIEVVEGGGDDRGRARTERRSARTDVEGVGIEPGVCLRAFQSRVEVGQDVEGFEGFVGEPGSGARAGRCHQPTLSISGAGVNHLR